MTNFNSYRVRFLIDHKINPKIMKIWDKERIDRLDNIINECGTKPITTYQVIYYYFYYILSI
jgi:hypothetical protein